MFTTPMLAPALALMLTADPGRDPESELPSPSSCTRAVHASAPWAAAAYPAAAALGT
ncbi:uncharacterized protein EHS24_008132 [Apiotrichum porosum]|uniref:Uncharacterized protein n=1 Tax=Apiotrichum porosum TaxID=105984 RepID=A0A427XSZ1_9TREE|nr:uncharacterized protein EHS24_008132 [Apiotrichum porosum]RSH81935.1 hypothetical protein EHS24_008132 [Apiotrichum porosum]